MGLIVLGVVLLAALHLLHLTIINQLLLPPLVFIIAGIMLHVRAVKKESRY